MFNPLIRSRLMDSIEGQTTVIKVLVDRVPAHSELWDRRVDPDRFTLREVLAHLVDYDRIWNEYMDFALGKSDGPAEVPMYTPDAVAALRDYSVTDPARSQSDLHASRARLVAKFRALSEDGWVRHAITSPRHGVLSIEGLAVLFVAHDGYHARQIAEYVAAA